MLTDDTHALMTREEFEALPEWHRTWSLSNQRSARPTGCRWKLRRPTPSFETPWLLVRFDCGRFTAVHSILLVEDTDD